MLTFKIIRNLVNRQIYFFSKSAIICSMINSLINNEIFISMVSNIQLQLVSFVFLIILVISYFKRKKLPILSTKCFSSMMIFSLVFVILDAWSSIIPFLELKQFWQIRMIYQLRSYSYLSVTVSIYLYVTLLLGRKQGLTPKERIQIFGVYILGIIAIMLAQLRSSVDTSGHFSFTAMNITTNVVVLIFAFRTIFDTIKYSIKNPKAFFKGKRKYIFWTTTIWIADSMLQLVNPFNTVLSLGIASMSFLMYLGLETPGDFIDRETEALNATALRLMLENLTTRRRRFFILNIDIDDFESIEEKFGEAIANQLIANVGDFINSSFDCPIFRAEPNSITIIVMQNKKNEHFYLVDKMLNFIKERMDKSWRVGENSFYISSHCDFIFYPNDVPENLSIHDFMRLIDDWHSYSEETGFLRRIDSKLIENRNREAKIIQLLTDAINSDGIEMYYQPIYEIKAERFSNFEALVRLKNTSTLGFVSPEEFIPIAERHGLIMKLSNMIFNQVFEFISSNKLEHAGLSHIEVNLSGLQSVDAQLPQQMAALMEKYKINPKIVNLEITESIAITSSFMLNKNMDELKKMGCSFSMDDFGTGYSNLSQIAKVNYELIKIDKSLLWPCFEKENANSANAKVILENMIKMILMLGRKIVVEGVETKEQYDYLKKLGVTYIQGYYFSKPLPSSEYLDFLRQK